MKNNQQSRGQQDQHLRTEQRNESLASSQENNESLNTSSVEQPVQNLRNEELGSGRSYDYNSQNPEPGLEGASR